MTDKKCNHQWEKIKYIRESRDWHFLILYSFSFVHEEKFVCLKCGEVLR